MSASRSERSRWVIWTANHNHVRVAGGLNELIGIDSEILRIEKYLVILPLEASSPSVYTV